MSSGVAAIILSAGAGQRLGAGQPKAFVTLGGLALFHWSARALAAVPGVTQVVLVVPATARDHPLVERLATELTLPLQVVIGGARRRDSVRVALDTLTDASHLLVHDAARALVTTELAARVLAAAQQSGAAIPVMPVGDALVRATHGGAVEEVPRADLRAIQTPQGFEVDLLRRAHAAAAADWDALDDGAMVRRLGVVVTHLPGDGENFKITWPHDLARARDLLVRRGAVELTMEADRVGFGWDVHPLVPGRPFRLVGVELTAEYGPQGHSDGDPLAHSVADALLGAAALGDIGQLFPDTDPRYAGIGGERLLAETVALLATHGFAPAQIDAVLITDQPKIAPFKDAIRAQLAEITRLPLDLIALKGKRTEGLGALSGGRGVECHAIARVRRTRPA